LNAGFERYSMLSSNAHILVTGGCGFIGSHLTRMLLRQRPGWRVTNLDALTYAGRRDNLADIENDADTKARYRFVHGNVCDDTLVTALLADTDAVIHAAAESHVDRSINHAAPFTATNILGTQTLLEALRRKLPTTQKQTPTVLISTDEVFGDLPLDQPDLKFDESSPYRPRSPYAASKAAGDMLALAYHHTFGLDVRITHSGNNLGPMQHPEKLIPRFITLLLQGKSVPLYGDGRNVRDWLSVKDHATAVLAVLEHGTPGNRYCVSANIERSNRQVTDAILKHLQLGEDRITCVPDRPGHDRRYAMHAHPLRSLGWSPEHTDFDTLLSNTIDWYAEHRDWWAD
jgi:dTDP-glucose 4,6-dehydratase